MYCIFPAVKKDLLCRYRFHTGYGYQDCFQDIQNQADSYNKFTKSGVILQVKKYIFLLYFSLAIYAILIQQVSRKI